MKDAALVLLAGFAYYGAATLGTQCVAWWQDTRFWRAVRDDARRLLGLDHSDNANGARPEGPPRSPTLR